MTSSYIKLHLSNTLLNYDYCFWDKSSLQVQRRINEKLTKNAGTEAVAHSDGSYVMIRGRQMQFGWL